MKRVVSIALREVRSQVVSPVAWSVAAGFLFLCGYVFFDLVARFAALWADDLLRLGAYGDPSAIERLSANELVVAGLYRSVSILLLFLVPALAMRLFADERRQGTMELLLTSPAGTGRIVLGKYLGLLAVALPIVSGAGAFVALLSRYAELEAGPLWTGWIGLLATTSVLCAIGVAAAAFAEGHVVAFVGSFVAGLLLFAVDWPAERVRGSGAEILRQLSLPRRLDAWNAGLATFADVVFFASWIVLALALARAALASERGR